MALDMTLKLPRPTGHHSITPSFIVKGADKIVDFAQRAFAAKVVDLYEGPGGIVFHAELQIGDSIVMLAESTDGPGGMPAMPAALSHYVDTGEAVDATYERALAAGAKSLRAPANQFYGYRSATVQDASGNVWTICAIVEQLTRAQIEQRMASQPH